MSFIIVFVAALFNAVMDRVGDTVAFNHSVFSNLNPRFWNKEVSWQYAKKIFSWKLDAWHICKSIVVCSLILGIVTYKPVFNPTYDFLIMGAIWNLTFNLFYSILKR